MKDEMEATRGSWIPFQAPGFPSATSRTPAVLSSDDVRRRSSYAPYASS